MENKKKKKNLEKVLNKELNVQYEHNDLSKARQVREKAINSIKKYAFNKITETYMIECENILFEQYFVLNFFEYSKRIQFICRHVVNHDASILLSQGITSKILTTMSQKDIWAIFNHPSSNDDMVVEFTEENIFGDAYGEVVCRKCKKRTVTSFDVQDRAMDEGITTYFYCECGAKW